MSYFIKQSTATRPLLFMMIDSADHIAGKTGLTPTVTVSKAGASFATPVGAITEVGNGWYQVAANATDSNTLGPLVLHATASGADPTDMIFRVVAFDPDSSTNLGLSTLDAAVSTRSTLAAGAQMDLVNAPNGTAVTAIQSGLATASATTAIKAKTDLIATNGADSPNAVTAQSTVSNRLDVAISSRATPGAQMDFVDAPNATAVTAIKSGLATSSATSAIKAKTDLIGTNSADSPNTADTQETIATNLDVAVSSRSTFNGTAVQSVTDPVTVGTNNDKTGYAVSTVSDKTGYAVSSVSDKTGYKLAADGLDTISVTVPSGSISTWNFRERMVMLFRRFFGKVSISTTQVKTYAANGTTVLSTQSVAETSNTQTQGEAA